MYSIGDIVALVDKDNELPYYGQITSITTDYFMQNFVSLIWYFVKFYFFFLKSWFLG